MAKINVLMDDTELDMPMLSGYVIKGALAHAQGRRRDQNPYHLKDVQIAKLWWDGWDKASKGQIRVTG